MPVNFLNNILLPDGARLAFGDSWDGTNADLDIYHDGTHSFISDQGTGNLALLTSQLVVNNAADSANMIVATQGGSVNLYYDGTQHFRTVSTGIEVTGSIKVTGDGSNATVLSESGTGDFTIDAVGDITLDADGNDIRFSDGGTQFGKFKRDGGNFRIFSSEDDKDLEFLGVDNGSTITALTLDMSEGGAANFNDKLTIGSIAEVGSDTDKFLMSDSGEVKYVTGSNLASYIGAVTGGPYLPLTAGSSVPLTDSLYIEASGTPQLNITDTTNNLVGRFRVGNTAMYIDADSGEGVASTSMQFQVDAETKLQLSETISRFLGSNVSIRRDDTVPVLNFERNDATIAAGNDLGQVIFKGADPSGYNEGARMSVEADGTWDTDTFPTRIRFEVKSTDTLRNALRINSDAEINFGQYGSGTFTGTSAYYLIADSVGNIIEKTPTQVRSDIGAGTGDGSVTSVAATAGTGISISGSPITSSGTLTITNTAPETFSGWVIRDDDGDDKTLSGSTNKYLKVTMANGTAGTNLSGTGTTGDPYVLALTSPGDSGGTVTGVTGSSPIASSGGNAPDISISNATGTTVGAAALDAGTGISLSDSSGVYTVTNSGVTSIVAGSNISISGATGAVTITATDTNTQNTYVLDKAAGSTDLKLYKNGSGTAQDTITFSGTANEVEVTGVSEDAYVFGLPATVAVTNALSCGTTMTVGSTLTVDTIAEVGSDTDKFLMSDSGVVKYVTGANLRSYIGAGTGSGSVTSVGFTHAGSAFSVAGQPVTGSGTIAVTMTGTSSQLVAGDGTLKNSADLPFVDGSGSANQVAYWSDSDTITGDTDLTFDGTNLTIGGDLTVTGGDITTNGVQTFSNNAASSALLIGDTSAGDEISTIDLWVMGTSQAQIEDGAFIIQNNCTLQLNSGSDIALNGDANIRLDASIAANQSSGIVLPLGSTSVTVNKVYYWKASSAWEETDADTEAKTNGLLAYANSSGTASTNRMVLQGIVFESGHGYTIGAPLYISTTAGDLSNTAPSGTGDCVRVVGYAITSDEIYFCPDNTWVKVS